MIINPAIPSTSLITTNDMSASDIATDQKFEDLLAEVDKPITAEDELTEITKGGIKGYMSWKVEQLKKQITARVMAGMNLTAEKIAGMPDKQRVDTEAKILKAVEDQLRLAIDQEMKKQQKQQLTSSAAMQGLLEAAQAV